MTAISRSNAPSVDPADGPVDTELLRVWRDKLLHALRIALTALEEIRDLETPCDKAGAADPWHGMGRMRKRARKAVGEARGILENR